MLTMKVNITLDSKFFAKVAVLFRASKFILHVASLNASPAGSFDIATKSITAFAPTGFYHSS